MFRPGTFVNTPGDGVGSLLFYTDYKPVEVEGKIEIQPKAAVVIFEDGFANKYPVDGLTIAEQPKKEPSSPFPETVERTSTDGSQVYSDTCGQAE